MRFDRKLGVKLKVEADAYLERLRHRREKTVVITAATAESFIPMRERDAGDDGAIHCEGVHGPAMCRIGLSEFPWALHELGKIMHLAQLQGSPLDARISDPFILQTSDIPEQIEIRLDELGREKHHCACSRIFWMSCNGATDRHRGVVTVLRREIHEPGTETFSEIRFVHCSDLINVAESVDFLEATPRDISNSYSRA